jgi:hypothetical protein
MICFRYIIFRNIIVPVSFFLLINGCCGSEETSGEVYQNQPSYKKIAEEKFNKDYRVTFNSDSTYLIVHYLPPNVTKESDSPLKFFVYDSKNKKVMFQDNLANGKVEWLNKHQLRVTTVPEIVKGKDEENKEMFGYIYDVISMSKLSKENRNK